MSNTNTAELVNYEFKTKKGIVTIGFEDVTENPKFKIKGPKDLIHKAIGGLGFETEDNTETIATEEHLKTESQRMFAVLEILKHI